jgi:hypothetical protein
MKDAQTVTYNGEGNITNIVVGFKEHAVTKKSKYTKKVEELERIKEEKRKNRKK